MLRPAVCLFVIWLLASPATAQLGPGFARAFANPVLETGGRQFAMTPVDLDGDGLPDLVTGHGREIVVSRNRGDGTVEELHRVRLSVAPYLLRHAASGDLDGDGDEDIVIAGEDPEWVFVLQNPGDGRLTETSRLAFEVVPVEIAIAEVTGDGHLDLIAVGWPSSAGPISPLRRLELRAGMGQATFGTRRVTKLRDSISDIVAADFNGDSVADLAFIDRVERSHIAVLLNDGQGGFSRVFLQPQPSVRSIEAADMDGDGDVDLITNVGPQLLQNRIGGHMVVFANDGSGSFAPASVTLYNPEGDALALGDLDGDGDPDVVVGGTGNRFTSHVFFNDGNAVLRRISSHPGLLRAPFVADMNGDGLTDIVYTGGLNEGPAVYFNLGRGLFPAPGRPSEARGTGAALADFSQDGRVDLAHAGGTPTFGLLVAKDLVDRQGRRSRLVSPLNDAKDLVTARLDKDGFPDLLVSGRGEVVTLRGSSGGLQPFGRVLLPGLDVIRIVAGDFDRDGDQDVIAVAADILRRYTLPLLQNTGNGELVFARFTGPGGVPLQLDSIDLDADGFEDLVFFMRGDGRLRIWLSRDGGFLPHRREVLFSSYLSGLAYADFDRDGDLDIAANPGTNIQLIENLGNGEFLPALELDNFGHGRLATGDVDGDGWPDLMKSPTYPGALALYRREPNGRFRAPEHYPTQLYPLIVRDLDGDGRDDLAGLTHDNQRASTPTRVLSVK